MGSLRVPMLLKFFIELVAHSAWARREAVLFGFDLLS